MSTFKLLYHTPLIDKGENIDYVNIVNNNTFIHNKMNDNTHFLNYTSGLFINMKNCSKFEILKMFLFNPFLDKKRKQQLIEYFCKIQKQYHSLSYFAFICKFKSAKIANDKDLHYNKINEKQPRILSLYVKNTKYLFSISDLKNIINNSLYNYDMLFSTPLSIKNPYDNSPFSKANLYNIYFFFKHNDIVIPTIYHIYFMTNFHISKFQSENEVGIRNYLIDNYLKLNTKSYVVKLIKKMLNVFNIRKPKSKILFNNKLPEDLIFNTFKYHVQLYYRYRHTLDLSIQENIKYKWLESLIKFKQNNPIFGRKMIKYNKETKTKYEYFKDACPINVSERWFNNDMNSHLDHTYDINNEDEDEDEDNLFDETIENENTHIHFNDQSEFSHRVIDNNIEITPTIIDLTDTFNDASMNELNYSDDSLNTNNLLFESHIRILSDIDTDTDSNSDDDNIFPSIINRTQILDCFSDDSNSSYSMDITSSD